MTRNRDPDGGPQRPRLLAWVQLCAACSLIAFLWIVVLPRLATTHHIQAELEHLEERRIDPSAMFYTELECLDQVLARLDRFRQQHPRALWLPESVREAN